jgi:hypothetical protein
MARAADVGRDRPGRVGACLPPSRSPSRRHLPRARGGGCHGAHAHGGVLVFDPLPGGGTPTLTQLRRHLERRLEALFRYRQRLSRARPAACAGRSGRRTIASTSPRTSPARRCQGQAESESCSPGCRLLVASARPCAALWRAVLLEGLAGGRWALVTKTHHCLVDGVGSIDAGTVLLDSEPKPGPWKPPARMPPAQVGGSANSLRRWPACRWRRRRRLRGGSPSATRRRGARRRTRTARVADTRGARRRATDEHQRPAQRASPAGVTEVPLEEIKAIKRALGGTVNDVIPRLSPQGCASCSWTAGRSACRGPAGDGAVNVREAAEHSSSGTASPRCSSIFRSRSARRAPATDGCVRRP